MSGGTDWSVKDFSRTGTSGRSGWLLTVFLLLILALVAGALVWASWARIEEIARASGRVVPSGKARTVESLEGGIVQEILVREGDLVEAMQVLVRMDDVGSSANLGELSAQQRALSARAIRLDAERLDLEQPQFGGSEFAAADPLVLREIALFDSRKASFFGQKAVLEAQLSQRTQEIAELRSAVIRVNETLDLLAEEIELKTDSGVIPRAQILPLERERTARKQELDSLQSRLEQAAGAEQEARARLTEIELQRRADISVERSDTLNQLSVINETIKRASDVVVRAALRAPVNGVVSALNVNTIGAVIAPGEEVLRIVPLNDRLQVEARVRPEDVAFIRPDLPARVKLTSFDFTIYGALDGHVIRVGADAEQDETTGEIYFPIIVETDSNTLTRGAETHDIRPGMIASVDILTGERTVLDYLLKPFRKASLEAMRER